MALRTRLRSGAWTAGPDVTYQTSHFASNKNFLAGAWPLGFVPRPGVQPTVLSVNYLPRPKRRVFGLRVRQMVNEFRTSLVHDLDGRWESYRVFMAPVNRRLESGDRFEYNVVPPDGPSRR